MTKKRWSSPEWKRYMRSRQDYQLSRQQKSRKRAVRPPPLIRFRPEHLQYIKLPVPERFSIIDNPEETIVFIRAVRHYSRANNLTLDLDGVTHITVDAITALVAEIAALGQLRYVRGTLPTNVQCRDLLNQSGFFDHVKSRGPLPPCEKGRIEARKSKLVEPGTARELIRIGTTAAHGARQKCYPAYSSLIECMSNTHNHATGKDETMGTERWYSAVYGDAERKRICCAFLDTGVGIFRSSGYKLVRRAFRLLKGEDDRDILKAILAGKEESRTGLPYRGKGLPGINGFVQRGEMKTLIIVANDVYANVSTNDFRLLRGNFPGTLLYWEA